MHGRHTVRVSTIATGDRTARISPDRAVGNVPAARLREARVPARWRPSQYGGCSPLPTGTAIQRSAHANPEEYS